MSRDCHRVLGLGLIIAIGLTLSSCARKDAREESAACSVPESRGVKYDMNEDRIRPASENADRASADFQFDSDEATEASTHQPRRGSTSRDLGVESAAAKATKNSRVRNARKTTLSTPRVPKPQRPRPAVFLPGEELWIIERPAAAATAPDDTAPGTGSMLARRLGEVDVPVPLEHTDVRGRISGYIASVDVTQRFHNPYDTKIEAVYVFPLPQNAAVTDFIMAIGERRIRGIIRERSEARRIYESARSQGHVASLLEQERPNIFTQSVANIEPGKKIDVKIKYFSTLAYTDGGYDFVFPMVVGPRFNPPGSTSGIGAAPRDAPGSTGQSTEVAYLRPHERSGHDIALTVDLEAGVEIESIASLTHAAAVERPSPTSATVTLSPNDAIPNRDFVLRYHVAGKTLKANFMTHEDERGGFFTLMLYPPKVAKVSRRPVELVFVVDCSGSMRGAPLAKAKDAMRRALKRLDASDSFQIIRFSSHASQLGSAPIAATPANVRRGLKYLEKLQSGGGTMMIEGIKAALDFPHDSERLRVVSFMTDGYIGNEAEIFAAVDQHLGAARLFSFGVGSSVNRYLIEGLARLGRGAVAYVGLDANAGTEVDKFYDRMRYPALSEVRIDWGGLEVSEVFPQRLPDLFEGRPVLVTGRYAAGGAADDVIVRIHGKAGADDAAFEVPFSAARPRGSGEVAAAVDRSKQSGSSAATHAAIPSVWARRKIAALMDAVHTRGLELSPEVRDLALEFNLVSAFTSFVAVDASRKTEGDHGIRVQVPVPVPVGVRYDTTVGGE